MAKVIGSITDVLSNVRAHNRTANNASPNPEAESYSQPNVPGNQGNGQAPPSSYPTSGGFLGSIPAQVYCNYGTDPYKPQYETYPVQPSEGDVPIVKTPAPYFMCQDPYDRPSEGVSVSPLDPRDSSPSKVSYDGAHG